MSELLTPTNGSGPTGGSPLDFRELEKELGRLALKDVDAQKREEKLEKELSEVREERQLIAMQKLDVRDKLSPFWVKQAKGKR